VALYESDTSLGIALTMSLQVTFLIYLGGSRFLLLTNLSRALELKRCHRSSSP
jgi:hypothetical protein